MQEEVRIRQDLEEDPEKDPRMMDLEVIKIIIEEGRNNNKRDPGRDPGDDPSDPSDDSPDDENPRRRRRIKKRIYLVQGPPGPPGKDGKDGKDKVSVDGKINEEGSGSPKLATALNALATSLTKFGDGNFRCS